MFLLLLDRSAFTDEPPHSIWLYVGVLALLFLFCWYFTKPRERKDGDFTFSDVSILPDGIYEVQMEDQFNSVYLATTTHLEGPYQKIYVVHNYNMPRNRDGSLVDIFIKDKGKVLP